MIKELQQKCGTLYTPFIRYGLSAKSYQVNSSMFMICAGRGLLFGFSESETGYFLAPKKDVREPVL